MEKHIEYKLKFYKLSQDEGRTIIHLIDSSAANEDKRGLSFIDALEAIEIKSAIATITAIQNNQSYDPDFLNESEIYDTFGITFNYPNIVIGGLYFVNINDFKLLLQEWLQYISS